MFFIKASSFMKTVTSIISTKESMHNSRLQKELFSKSIVYVVKEWTHDVKFFIKSFYWRLLLTAHQIYLKLTFKYKSIMQLSRSELLNLLKFVHDQPFATSISLLLRSFMKRKQKTNFLRKRWQNWKKITKSKMKK